MSQKKPSFEGGNRSIAKAMNRLADALWRHGVNPGGRPGWVETKDGWMPPAPNMGGDGSASLLWSLKVITEEGGGKKVSIVNPGLVRKTMALDATGIVNIADLADEFTPAANKLLVLEYLPTLATTLKMVDEWDGWPMPVDTVETDPGGLWVMSRGYHVLYDFRSSSDDSDAIKIQDNLYAERRAYNDHLMFVNTMMEDKDAHFVPFWELLPAQSCRRS